MTQITEVREKTLNRLFKARNPDLYYDTSHMKCYEFVQQCEDHFITAGAKGHKRMYFAIFSLKEQVFAYWQQHKLRTKHNSIVPISWGKFKVFL